MTVENVRPNVLDQTTAESEARALAFQKARAKAEQYAELAGAQCGRAMNIFEKQGEGERPMHERREGEGRLRGRKAKLGLKRGRKKNQNVE